MKRLLGMLLVMVTASASVLAMGFGFAAADAIPRYAMDYQGGISAGTTTRTVNFDEVDDDYYENPYEAPVFKNSYVGACAVDSGGNALVYYDRIYDDLVPDYKHNYVWGKFTYGTQNAGINNMFASLYQLMDTNDQGTTIPGFKSGLAAYVSGRGRTLTLTGSTGSHYGVNIDYLKQQLKQEKMAVVFLNNFAIVPSIAFERTDNADNITYSLYNGYHTVLVYGYRDIYYYDAAGNVIERDTYLLASTGFVGATLAYIYMDDYGTIDDAYIVNIA